MADDKPSELTVGQLSARAGVTRATIHHYVALGLLPAPRKTGERRALYAAESVGRVQAIKELQSRRFLPLRVVRSVLDGSGPTELRRVAARLLPKLEGAGLGRRLTRGELLRRGGLGEDVLTELERIGLVRAGADDRFGPDDAEVCAAVRAMRAAGMNEKLGFEPEAMGLYREVCERLLDVESRIFNPRVLGKLSPQRAAALAGVAAVESSRLLGALHRRLLRERIEAILGARPVSGSGEVRAKRGRRISRARGEAGGDPIAPVAALLPSRDEENPRRPRLSSKDGRRSA